MKKIITTIYIVFTILYSVQAQPVLVKSISPKATNFTTVGDVLFYTSNDSLFKSDGTVAGTSFLHAGLNNPQSFLINNGLLYFITVPYQLWRSDGTIAGTIQLAVSDPSVPFLSILGSLGNKVVFTMSHPVYDQEPFITNGTVAGTTLLKDIYPGHNPSVPRFMGVLNGEMFFSALTFNEAEGDADYELWKTNGTTSGTAMVKNINPSGSGISFGTNRYALTSMDVFFVANDGIHGSELWKSNGTEAGTVMVKDIVPGTSDSYSFSEGEEFHAISTPVNLTEAGGVIYFFAGEVYSPSGDYQSLWKSNGTAAGTVLVKNIQMDNIQSLFEVNDKLIITGMRGIASQMWASNGTESGTILIKDQLRGGDNYLSDFHTIGDQMIFTDNVQGFAYQLWKTNGTAGGTQLIRNMNSRPNDFEVVGNTLFFTEHGVPTFFEAGDGINDYELWQSNLTPETTFMVKDIAHVSFAGSHNLTNVNGTLYFTTSIPVSNPSFVSSTISKKLWKYSLPVLEVSELILVDAGVDTDIRPLASVDTIYMDQNSTIRAQVSGQAKSVRFYINDVLAINENKAPYALAGDNNGDFHKWDKAPGLYKISAIPFAGNNGSGAAGEALISYVRVLFPTDTATHIPFVLVNALSDADLRTLHNKDTISLMSSDKISIKAMPAFAESVVFVLNGTIFKTESSAPFSLNGDVGGNYSPWTAAAGDYSLIAKAYSGYSGTGTLLQTDTMHFTVLINTPLVTRASVYPNPYKENTHVYISSVADQKVKIILTDNMGRIYLQQHVQLNSGDNSIPIDLDEYHLSQGVYYVKISGEKEDTVLKIYKN